MGWRKPAPNRRLIFNAAGGVAGMELDPLDGLSNQGPMMNNANVEFSPTQEREVPRRLKKYARQQVRKLRQTYKAAKRSQDPEVVHDLRVLTRRLQTMLDLATLSDSNGASPLKKKLRKLRHVLSLRRDTDVLGHAMRSRGTRAASAARRRLWNRAARKTREEGGQADKQSRRWLRRHKIGKLASGIKEIVADRLDDGFSSRDLAPALHRVQQKWKQAIRAAASASDSSRLHNARIKTKSLRYMIELISRLTASDRGMELIEHLKGVQDELGEWRDQAELTRKLTAALSEDAGLQADPVATAMIDAARGRTHLNNEHARRIVASMRKTGAQEQFLVAGGPENPRVEAASRSK
jgi:CHAD domain-containing protein